MSDLSWRKVKTIEDPLIVPSPAGSAWTPALDYVTPKRFYRITVIANHGWGPNGHPACSSDGHSRHTVRNPMLIADSPLGCLIAKVGGGTADNKGELLPIGRRCVFQMEEGKAGPLYLGINDHVNEMPNLVGELIVEIETAL